MNLRRLFDPQTPCGTLSYAGGCVAAYASQPLYVLWAARATELTVGDWGLWLLPFRRLTQIEGLPPAFLAGGLVLMLAVACVLALLSFRRTASDGADAGLAAVAIVPVIQFAAFAWFVLAPMLRRPSPVSAEAWRGDGWAAVTQAILAGTGLMVFAVAASTLVFGAYGFGLFVLSPLLVGFATGFLVNRRTEPRSAGATAGWVFGATFIGSAMLIAFGLEGGICMVMASPIMAGPAIVGGLVGREFAIAGRARTKPVVMSLAIMPLAFAVDAAMPPETLLITHETIEIDAPPSLVWAALIDMGEIGPEPALPFRLGLAYPLRAEFRGAGVGAERIGVFSTGEAHERVTAWEPGRRLAFEVLIQPPAMRELSPHRIVHAPHAIGYFETAWTSFDLWPTASGGTRLVERAEHRLRLEPVAYWAPMARWAIQANNARVLDHIRRTAEASVARAQPSPASGGLADPLP
ncbi:SRPBCC family protein [Phenylobacterium sp. SCN 70-31]|uniref:SRPBCC family protein n=1 Tax=Phenylobacterium sp. SCN 70-31 TaxID=1660129 RepID=UPI000868D1DE|nr:SRPBCC family protein [Phenylobacterium sp. SCN 70-31]ODT85323.1 MAG: hypothetical protein ABS78_20800 [Phenylobacterium sp. SCN 70-31]